jgi:hypothetical protein
MLNSAHPGPPKPAALSLAGASHRREGGRVLPPSGALWLRYGYYAEAVDFGRGSIGRLDHPVYVVARTRSRAAPGVRNRPSARRAESVTHHPPAHGGRRLNLVAGVEEDLE